MPYSRLPKRTFWRNCRESVNFLSSEIHQPKFEVKSGTKVATAGSCFAQSIGSYIRQSDLQLVDVEPAPEAMLPKTAKRFGYGLFSARYGNIYTPRQLSQLLSDCKNAKIHDCAIWEKDGRFFDALRPNVEPDGLLSEEEVKAHRRDHLLRVHSIFDTAEVFVFTLGLTECWVDRRSGIVFPSAPGVIAGKYDQSRCEFQNLDMASTYEDLAETIEQLRKFSPDLKIILTVSPVPLVATATGQHVLRATTYSKSVLRAVAEEITACDDNIDYFPSYEIVAGAPFSATSFEPNCRSVAIQAVQTVMDIFFAAYGRTARCRKEDEVDLSTDADEDLVCEDILLETFASR